MDIFGNMGEILYEWRWFNGNSLKKKWRFVAKSFVNGWSYQLLCLTATSLPGSMCRVSLWWNLFSNWWITSRIHPRSRSAAQHFRASLLSGVWLKKIFLGFHHGFHHEKWWFQTSKVKNNQRYDQEYTTNSVWCKQWPFWCFTFANMINSRDSA